MANIFNHAESVTDFPGSTSGKGSTCQFRRLKRCGFDPWVRKILWRRKWQPTPVFLPGEFHGQRSLVGYSPWGLKEPDMNEQRLLQLLIHGMSRESTNRLHINKWTWLCANKTLLKILSRGPDWPRAVVC